ncbi:SNF2 family N-terminal domain-containing protein [Epithele typhae]|uniref:SNF2 family N-terminal domain-containing protein n=1 Tax=Epithele typhae TaxID=378194 RepID=UPI002007C959|nr:SNF2 family N-terminal domain-containing protein [Epithele typhae]KAH9912764.1 SNF2 family N-terminal domain-containing protein [Epithele typhae]
MPEVTPQSSTRKGKGKQVAADPITPLPRNETASISAPPASISKRASVQQPVDEPSISPVKHPVQRVKLIVRKPSPLFSHPLQRPPLKKHDGSLDAILSSFVTRHGYETTTENIDAELEEELDVWRRVDALQREGRLVERSSYEFRGAEAQDTWAHVVREIEEPGVRFIDGREMAANVAGKIRKHWQMENKAEEARMKILAKSTLNMVLGQWRKAVYHVREQERLEWEAEERRRGQEHLNAILDQSGQILQVQRLDLVRESRSRSRSVASPDPELGPNGSDNEGTMPATEDGEGQADHDSEESDSSAEDEGISMLLPDIDMEVDSASQIIVESPRELEMDVDLKTPSEEEDNLEEPLPSSPPSRTEQSEASTSAVGTPKTTEKILTHFYAERKPSPAFTPMVLDMDDDAFLPHTPQLVKESPLNEISNGTLDATLAQDDLPAGWTPPFKNTTLPDNTLTDGPPVLSVKIPVPETPAPPTPPISSHGITPVVDDEVVEEEEEDYNGIPYYLRPYAVAPVEWDPDAKVKPPLLLRGNLRPYQQAGLEWLASIHARNLNGILADEMGLGKTIQTIALLAHLACERGIWGPHLIIVPTSVLLNWEMEFKKFLPGFNVLPYHGNTKQRKELRQGWNNKYHFNVCITSYTLASRDSHVFKRKRWYYMILDEAHMIKNFKSQRWNTLLMFRSFRRLLLTGTPLQNNLTELWALLQFLMSGTDFANLKEFADWFANPLERAIELGSIDDETQARVTKLHQVLRPYLLRRLKRDVEKELPQKFEHIIMCPLSKRQRFLYDEFMGRTDTRHDLQSGVYQKIANILMQLRKVVNHPDLFEVRPIVTSFAMQRSAVADFEIKELLVRRQLLSRLDEDTLNLDFLGFEFVHDIGLPEIAARETKRLDGTQFLPMINDVPGQAPPRDTRTIRGFKKYTIGYPHSHYGAEKLALIHKFYSPLLPPEIPHEPKAYLTTPTTIRSAIKSVATRAEEMAPFIDRFAFVTPFAVARDLPLIALPTLREDPTAAAMAMDPAFDAPLHRASVKLQIAFPDPSLLQYDCGKLQVLAQLLRDRKAGGHRVLIFTQMTRILDILEIFLNFHGYLYLRLDGATKIEDRQYITERFNADPRVFCFISSSRSGGVGINLTGADTVIFYDSDFNPQMDRQCEDRAHRIGQIRDVHIYRFVSQHTVEEALLRKANQKRSLDALVIQRGAFDWSALLDDTSTSGALVNALGEYEDVEDAAAARVAAREEMLLEDDDAADFGGEKGNAGTETPVAPTPVQKTLTMFSEATADTREAAPTEEDAVVTEVATEAGEGAGEDEDEDEEGRTIDDYMIDFVSFDADFFEEWSM